MKKRFLTGAIVALVALVVVAALVGCGSRPKNLEEYYDAHPDEYAQLESSFQQGFSSASADFPAKAAIDIVENEIVVDVNVEMILDEATRASAAAALEPQAGMFDEELKPELTKLEEETGYSPITMKITYYDKGKNEIFSHTVS